MCVCGSVCPRVVPGECTQVLSFTGDSNKEDQLETHDSLRVYHARDNHLFYIKRLFFHNSPSDY